MQGRDIGEKIESIKEKYSGSYQMRGGLHWRYEPGQCVVDSYGATIKANDEEGRLYLLGPDAMMTKGTHYIKYIFDSKSEIEVAFTSGYGDEIVIGYFFGQLTF